MEAGRANRHPRPGVRSCITTWTVRYHLRRRAEGAEDGRRDKRFLAESQAEVIAVWIETHGKGRRPANLKELYEHLVEEHGQLRLGLPAGDRQERNSSPYPV